MWIKSQRRARGLLRRMSFVYLRIIHLWDPLWTSRSSTLKQFHVKYIHYYVVGQTHDIVGAEEIVEIVYDNVDARAKDWSNVIIMTPNTTHERPATDVICHPRKRLTACDDEPLVVSTRELVDHHMNTSWSKFDTHTRCSFHRSSIVVSLLST